MAKRKNQQRKRNKAVNLSLGPAPEGKNPQKTKNATMITDNKIHSSLKDNANTEVIKSNVTQPLSYASALKKGFKSTNMKNVMVPKIMESETLFPVDKNLTFQDTVEEELLDFFGSHNSDHNKCDKVITQSSKSVEKKSALIQDFKRKTVNTPLKENIYVNNGNCISDQRTSNASSSANPGYKFSNEENDFKAQQPEEISNTVNKIQIGKSDPLNVKDYSIQKKTVNTMQKKSSLIVEKPVSDKNTLSSSVSIYWYKVKSLQSQNSNKVVSENKEMQQKIYSSVNVFKKSSYNFYEKYKSWRTIRLQTLKKLKQLVRDLHDCQLAFNKAQKTCREMGCISRRAKPTPSTLGYIASVSAFLSDAASGITSAVQAVNVDIYLNKFNEIMDLDTKATKDLYNAISLYIEGYQGIEEVMRMYHSPTFNLTVSKIANDLEVKKFWMDISNAYKDEDLSKMLSVVGNFLENGSRFEVLQKIGDSIVTYVDENPATLEVCNSVCRAACGAIDSLFIDKRQTSILSCMAHASNELMISNDTMEINRLNYIIDDNSSQSKLEDKMHDTIDSLKFEMQQITDAYIQHLSITAGYFD